MSVLKNIFVAILRGRQALTQEVVFILVVLGYYNEFLKNNLNNFRTEAAVLRGLHHWKARTEVVKNIPSVNSNWRESAIPKLNTKSMGIEKNTAFPLCAQILSHSSVQSITCKVFNELVNNELIPSPVSTF